MSSNQQGTFHGYISLFKFLLCPLLFAQNVRHFTIHIRFIKISFFSNFQPEISTSAPLTCTEHSSLILICALKLFTEALVHKSLFTAGFMWHFIPINIFFWLFTVPYFRIYRLIKNKHTRIQSFLLKPFTLT